MIFILDDETYLSDLVRVTFPQEKFKQFRDSKTFIKAVKKNRPELLLIDLRIDHAKDRNAQNYLSKYPEYEGLAVLEYLRKKHIKTPAILITRFASSDIFMRVFALQAIPLEVTDLQQASRSLKEKGGHFLKNHESFHLANIYKKYNFIAASPASLETLETAEKLADSSHAILICGESGVGKDALARAIHLRSSKAQAPFINFVISAYPQNLLYSQLFGTVRNAYTGATDRPGCFEEVAQGTLVLNEIGDLDIESQIQLLQVLENRYFSRLGEHKRREFNGRIIALTNKDLIAASEQGLFREDLYNRLRKFLIHIPPLRERREDIPAFIEYYLPEAVFSSSALHFLTDEFSYPGNMRTLKFILDRLKKLAPSFPRISLDDVISAISDLKKFNAPESSELSPQSLARILDLIIDQGWSMEEFTFRILNEALKRFGSTWSAENWGKLGITKATFYRKIKAQQRFPLGN